MAGIGGAHGDGFNTQAMHPQLESLMTLARDQHTASGRDPKRFVASVFAGLSETWLRPDSQARQKLARVGIDRLILLIEPPFDAGQIQAAGRLLSARS
jgi:hypothetical protein